MYVDLSKKLVKLVFVLSLLVTTPFSFGKELIDVVTKFDLDRYRGQLFKLALSYSEYTDFRLQQFPEDIPTYRAYNLMADDNGIDVITGTSTQERETQHRAIYIPIFKGLNGWRIPVVHQDNSALLEEVADLATLRPLQAIQFHQWTDTRILRSNQLNLITGSNFYGMYRMLSKKRADYLPQSVLAAQQNLDDFHNLNLMLDQHVVLHYLNAVYFYVRKDNTMLANIIETGLNKAIEDGSFDKLFNQHFAKTLKEINLANRTKISLHNQLTDKAPLGRKELWYSAN